MLTILSDRTAVDARARSPRVATRGLGACPRRAAFTLLEVLLTLCLLVVLASLTWPALGRPMAAQRLRDSADQVRTEWVRARVEAMSSGHTQVFRFTPEGDAYTIDAYASEDDSTAETAASPLGRVGLDIEEPAASRSQQRRLPDKVQFVADQAAGQSAGQRGSLGSRLPDFGIPSTPSGAGSAAGTLATGDAGQSPPIFFYADGTCSDAQVWLRNEYGQTVSLSLRGLTGVVLVSEVRSAEARVQ